MGSGRIDFAHREAAFSGHSPETATGDLGGVSVGERALFFAHRYVSQNDGVLLQALVVYSIVAVGFLMLYLMMKNTARLNQVRKGVREVLKAEAGRVFSDTDAALLNRGMGLI